MLVLSRKVNQSLIINDNIKIVVAEIRGGKVRLGIEAPREIPIIRKELQAKLNRNSARTIAQSHEKERAQNISISAFK